MRKNFVKRTLGMLLCMIVATAFSFTTVSATAKPGKVENVKIGTVAETSVVLKWKKVKNASGYEVCRNGETVRNVTKTSFTDTSLQEATAYIYKVRAYTKSKSKTLYGNYSDAVKVVTNPGAVGNLKVAARTTSSVTLKWAENEKVSGYQITRNGKTIQKRFQGTEYVDQGLKDDTEYIYAVRAYIKYTVNEWYNTKTKKWTETKPEKKYRGKSKKVVKYRYGKYGEKILVRTQKDIGPPIAPTADQ